MAAVTTSAPTGQSRLNSTVAVDRSPTTRRRQRPPAVNPADAAVGIDYGRVSQWVEDGRASTAAAAATTATGRQLPVVFPVRQCASTNLLRPIEVAPVPAVGPTAVSGHGMSAPHDIHRRASWHSSEMPTAVEDEAHSSGRRYPWQPNGNGANFQSGITAVNEHVDDCNLDIRIQPKESDVQIRNDAASEKKTERVSRRRRSHQVEKVDATVGTSDGATEDVRQEVAPTSPERRHVDAATSTGTSHDDARNFHQAGSVQLRRDFQTNVRSQPIPSFQRDEPLAPHRHRHGDVIAAGNRRASSPGNVISNTAGLSPIFFRRDVTCGSFGTGEDCDLTGYDSHRQSNRSKAESRDFCQQTIEHASTQTPIIVRYRTGARGIQDGLLGQGQYVVLTGYDGTEVTRCFAPVAVIGETNGHVMQRAMSCDRSIQTEKADGQRTRVPCRDFYTQTFGLSVTKDRNASGDDSDRNVRSPTTHGSKRNSTRSIRPETIDDDNDNDDNDNDDDRPMTTTRARRRSRVPSRSPDIVERRSEQTKVASRRSSPDSDYVRETKTTTRGRARDAKSQRSIGSRAGRPIHTSGALAGEFDVNESRDDDRMRALDRCKSPDQCMRCTSNGPLLEVLSKLLAREMQQQMQAKDPLKPNNNAERDRPAFVADCVDAVADDVVPGNIQDYGRVGGRTSGDVEQTTATELMAHVLQEVKKLQRGHDHDRDLAAEIDQLQRIERVRRWRSDVDVARNSERHLENERRTTAERESTPRGHRRRHHHHRRRHDDGGANSFDYEDTRALRRAKRGDDVDRRRHRSDVSRSPGRHRHASPASWYNQLVERYSDRHRSPVPLAPAYGSRSGRFQSVPPPPPAVAERSSPRHRRQSPVHHRPTTSATPRPQFVASQPFSTWNRQPPMSPPSPVRHWSPPPQQPMSGYGANAAAAKSPVFYRPAPTSGAFRPTRSAAYGCAPPGGQQVMSFGPNPQLVYFVPQAIG